MKSKSNSEKLDFLNSFIYRTELSKDGNNVSIWCPFCNHRKKTKLKLVIHLEKCFYHCWICDKKGSDISYVISKIDKSKVEKARLYFKKPLKNTFDLDIKGLFEEELNYDEDEIVEIPKGFKILANAFNSRNPDVRAVFKYALKRGINKHKMWYLRLGYSLDDEFRRMLLIPSFDKDGKINFYTGRRIDVDTHSPIKYKNSKNKKKNIVFNELNIDWKKELTIVEGPLDLLKTNDNSTCLLGSSLNESMLLFKRIVENKTSVILALDKDVYGKTLSIANKLYEYNIDVRIADVRGADDVGDMDIKEVENILKNANKFEKNDLLLNKISRIL
tara:strand:+ start:155 stop:1147 length:993 start_codon:yes stop_codon:yes gene_type:complete